MLFILNLYVNYFLFKGTAKLLAVKPKKWRMILGCILGGLYSMVILLDMGPAELIFVKIGMAATLVLLVFFQKNLLHMLKCGLYFFLVNFLYAGFMAGLWIFAAPPNMAYKNGVAYFDISAFTLIISTILAYLCITVVTFLFNRRGKQKEIIPVTLNLSGRQVMVQGLIDTGNKLTDVFSGLPVIVCAYDSVKDVFPGKTAEYFKDPIGHPPDSVQLSGTGLSYKMIPVHVVGSDALLPAFRPDSIQIEGLKRDAVVAVTDKPLSNGNYDAIVNIALLN